MVAEKKKMEEGSLTLLTSTEMAEIWNISARRISRLCSDGRVEGAFKKGKTWLIPKEAPKPEDPRRPGDTRECRQKLNIQNRRYLGNKYKLLNFIDETVQKHCPGVTSMLDIFAGTGVVAYHFMDKMKVVTNDILYSNYLAHMAFMSNMTIRVSKIEKEVELYNKLNAEKLEENYMSAYFGDTYFSHGDCKKIGYIRERIQEQFVQGEINEREQAVLITILLYAMDRVANTCGHYDAYRKGAAYERPLVFMPLDLSKKPKTKNLFYNGDSNALIQSKAFPKVDCVYCDPPYNSRNYCDLYHVLENVAKWEKPEVTGIARKMDRSGLKSKYCSRDAAKAFEELVDKLSCKYIILSYNNTGESADDRSNARMSDEDIMRILSQKGTVKVYSQKYKAFTAGKSENNANEERLFVCTVFTPEQKRKQQEMNAIVKSPLNYTGGKTKLLSQILPLFPQNINTFVDMFCGGANVGINVKANHVIYNDINEKLIGLFKVFSKYQAKTLIKKVELLIKQYELSDSDKNGYAIYGCNSADGLGNYNKERFRKLRDDFNKLTVKDDNYYIMLYVLIIFSFNNQIRFNRKGAYNLPVGKRDFNKNMKKNLIEFVTAVQKQSGEFLCRDFRTLNIADLGANDFVYCDPPYLITTASYNEQDGWNEQNERELLELLDKLNAKGIRFALSNVTLHKGKKNQILLDWAKKYNIHSLDFNYKNSNYHGKNKEEKTQEVLITNY